MAAGLRITKSGGANGSGDANGSVTTWRYDRTSAQAGGSDDDGLWPVLEEVLEPKSNRRLDVQVHELLFREEPDVARFVAAAQLTAHNAAGEADRELLAHLAA